MSYLIKEAVKILREDGPVELTKRSIRFVHRKLPKSSVKYNGVLVKNGPLFDPVLPWRDAKRPNYESGILNSMEENLKKGDSVVVVGGGHGVTAVKAAEHIGEGGDVMVYEGGVDKVDKTKQTAELNGVSDRIEVRHGIVGPSIWVWGEEEGAKHYTPDELPDCDVLELDCEGAEIDILENLEIRPRVIIVETHGTFDAPTDKVRGILEDLSYTVVSEEIADLDQKENCLENDIRVLTGILKN
jgi:signal peptidase I